MPHTKETTTTFFKTGGTLGSGVPSYVSRPADAELAQQIMQGEFCYVLTSRQMGKSSLMIRTAEQLNTAGYHTAVVDLSGIGTQLSCEQWYQSILKCLVRDLRLSIDIEQWWNDHPSLTFVQRFGSFLYDVVLAEIDTKIVIFIDEIDTTLMLDFTDDFFAAIRYIYNLRASDPTYDRLVFVLLGVATPTDLMKDRDRTPFNVGTAIDLQEFSREDATPLEKGLEAYFPEQGKRILDRIFYWTNGHPYLTQRLCREVSESPEQPWNDDAIDQLVTTLFLAKESVKDDNLQFVRNNVESSPDRRALLLLYQRVYRGEQVREDERSLLQSRLRLIGLVRVSGKLLQVRNPIYKQVFNLHWVKKNTPINWLRMVPYAAALVSLVVIVAIVIFYQQQQAEEIANLQQWFHEKEADDVEARLYYMNEICEIKKSAAQDLFLALPDKQQRALFSTPENMRPVYGKNLVAVCDCLAPKVEDPELENAMCCALQRVGGMGGHQQRKNECVCTDSLNDE